MKFVFIGKTSMGFVSGKEYHLKIKMKPMRLNGKKAEKLVIYDLHSKAWCPYDSVESFLMNWQPVR